MNHKMIDFYVSAGGNKDVYKINDLKKLSVNFHHLKITITINQFNFM